MNVLLCGYGAIGKRLEEKINSDGEYNLVGIVDPLGNTAYKEFESINQQIDVIIDFSHHSVVSSLLDFALNRKIPVVIATTGHTIEEEQLIKDTSKKTPILFTANTSLGINVLSEVLKQVTRQLGVDFDIEIIEKHHNLKKDSPSGTAKLLADSIISERESNLVYGRQGMQQRESNEIGIHAVRGGTIPGEHTVMFAGNDEIIEIKHQALSKQVFVTGALKAAKFITKQTPGLYTMKDVLH